jgi:hypothetical protein
MRSPKLSPATIPNPALQRRLGDKKQNRKLKDAIGDPFENRFSWNGSSVPLARVIEKEFTNTREGLTIRKPAPYPPIQN